MRLDTLMRVKMVKSNKFHKAGEVVEVSPNVAFGLIDSGMAVLSKDMTPDDYKQAGVKHGKFTKLRPNNSK